MLLISRRLPIRRVLAACASTKAPIKTNDGTSSPVNFSDEERVRRLEYLRAWAGVGPATPRVPTPAPVAEPARNDEPVVLLETVAPSATGELVFSGVAAFDLPLVKLRRGTIPFHVSDAVAAAARAHTSAAGATLRSSEPRPSVVSFVVDLSEVIQHTLTANVVVVVVVVVVACSTWIIIFYRETGLNNSGPLR
jgi:hypothetical protein